MAIRPVGYYYTGSTLPATVKKATPPKLQPAYTPPQLPGFTAPVSTIKSYLPYGGTAPTLNLPPSTSAATSAAAPGNQVLTSTRLDTSNPYVSDITAEPDYQSAATARQSSLDALRSALRTANQNAIIAGGFQVDPSKLTGDAAQFGGDIDAATLAAAAQNQFSTRAQLQESLNKGLALNPYELARRGAARSGAAVTHAEDLNRQYEVAANQAQNALLSGITGNISNYFGNVTGVENTWQQAQRDIAMRLAQLAAGRNKPTETTYIYTNPDTGEETPVPLLDPNQTVEQTPQGSTMINLPPARTPASTPFATNAALSAVNRAIAANKKKRGG